VRLIHRCDRSRFLDARRPPFPRPESRGNGVRTGYLAGR
jgi:hypothetical protein